MGLGCPYLKITVNKQFISGKLLFGELFSSEFVLVFTYLARISGFVSALLMAQGQETTNHLVPLLYIIIGIVLRIPSYLCIVIDK